jgi:hypothetical protein
MGLLRDYMIEKRIHHTFWCFNENSGDTGGLIAGSTNWTEWDMEKYEFVEPSLWQTDDGLFISLDHKIPLGQNGTGISLSDYYSGNTQPSTKPSTEPTTTPTTAPTTEPKTEPTTAPTTVPTTTPDSGDVVYGDANCDGVVTIADAAAIYQAIGNSDKYSLSEKGTVNADCFEPGSGLTVADGIAIQKFDAKLIDALPEK